MNIVSVTDWPFSAKGDGSSDDTAAIQAAIDFCFGPASTPHGGKQPWLNKPLYFPSGRYRVTSPLKLTAVMGGKVFGSARMAVQIIQATPGAAVISTNGLSYSEISGLRLIAATGGTCLDLDWDGQQANACALQSNRLVDLFFDGGDYGACIGKSGFMGSENTFYDPFFMSNVKAGLVTKNWNALCNRIYGGDAQNCGSAVLVEYGSVNVIDGLSIQESTNWDIWLQGDANDATVIRGVRTESPNFVQPGGTTVILIGCTQPGGSPGTFIQLAQSPAFHIEGCVSLAGQVLGGGGVRGTIQNCQFGRLDWNGIAGLTAACNIELVNITYNGTRDSGPGPGGFQYIARQRMTAAGVQNYVVQ